MELKNGERIDDLQLNGLKIIQNEKGFCFGIDAVLLSDFAKNNIRLECLELSNNMLQELIMANKGMA